MSDGPDAPNLEYEKMSDGPDESLDSACEWYGLQQSDVNHILQELQDLEDEEDKLLEHYTGYTYIGCNHQSDQSQANLKALEDHVAIKVSLISDKKRKSLGGALQSFLQKKCKTD